MLYVYTDGSCLGNPGRGGYAAVLVDNEEVLAAISGGFEHTTNNRMELRAAIEGLNLVPANAECVLISDSKYVVNTVNLGWKRKKNVDLWIELDKAILRCNPEFKWVKGHSGTKFNELVDKLAREAASQPNLPVEPVGLFKPY